MFRSRPRLNVTHVRKATPVLLCVVLSLFATKTARADEMVVADAGKSAYHIVVAVDASVQDYYAALELQRYVKEMAGAQLPIVTDDNALRDAEIVVGFNRHAARLVPHLKRDDFGPEEFLIKALGGRLVIVGGTPRGVVYGVNSLLVDQWGCRWFEPGLKRIPQHARLALPQDLDRRFKPAFEWRDAYFWAGLDNEWAVHNFQNKDFARLRLEQGGRAGLSHIYFPHTALTLVPPQKFRAEHPDYFWTGTGDQPRSGRTTTEGRTNWIGLCISHPDVARIAAEHLLQARRETPEGDLLYGVAGSDYDDWCECPRCKGWYAEDGGAWPYGAAWLRFAGAVEQHLRGKANAPRVSVLAYGGAAEPPTKPMRVEHVNVLYAELGVCQYHLLSDPDCPNNATFRKRLKGWLASSDSTYVWMYKVNFNNWFYINPNLHVLAEHLRYLRNAGVDGVFFEGNGMGWSGARFDGEFSELRAYLVARLMWDPKLDWRELRREYCAAYYGEQAGPVIEEYIDDVIESLQRHGPEVHTRAECGNEAFAWVTPDMFARWHSYFERAEALAADADHKRRVRIARLPVSFTETNLIADPAERKVHLQRFLDSARKLGSGNHYTINGHFMTWAQQRGLEWR